MVLGVTLVNPDYLSINVANEQVTISWESIADATGYNIYYDTSDTIPDSPSFANVQALSLTIPGLVNGTLYYFWVKAVYANDIISDESPMASGMPLGIPVVTVSPAYKQLLVEWGMVDGATSYDVYYSESGSLPAFPAFTNVTGLSQEIPYLDNGRAYYIWVKAKNNYADTNDPSAMVSGTPGVTPGLYWGARRVGDLTLNDALTEISSRTAVTYDNFYDFYIVLGTDENVSNNMDLYYSGRTVSITLLGYDNTERTITFNASATMYISSQVTLTLGENITLIGWSGYSNSLINVSGGNLIINNGAKITGNNVNNNNGGGVYIAGGNFNINRGTISGIDFL
jgi:hypothetical protein